MFPVGGTETPPPVPTYNESFHTPPCFLRAREIGNHLRWRCELPGRACLIPVWHEGISQWPSCFSVSVIFSGAKTKPRLYINRASSYNSSSARLFLTLISKWPPKRQQRRNALRLSAATQPPKVTTASALATEPRSHASTASNQRGWSVTAREIARFIRPDALRSAIESGPARAARNLVW
jgi:hypothetical protein